MGFFDGSTAKQIGYLEDERKKIWERLSSLEKHSKELQKSIDKKASDFEKEAASSSKKSAEYRNKTEQRFEEATTFVELIKNEHTNIIQIKDNIQKVLSDATEVNSEINTTLENLNESESKYSDKISLISEKISTFEDFFSDHDDLETELEELEISIKTIEDNLEKSNISLTSTNKRKKEIDDLHREIFGYTQTDSNTGEKTIIGGVKTELENSYNKLSTDLKNAFQQIEKLHTNLDQKYLNFEDTHKNTYQKITEEIESLLPRALTAGLSSAFSSKKEDEITSSIILQSNFTRGILALTIISLLPIGISIYFLIQKTPIEEVILRLPRLVLSIAPIYLPALWFTYSANKKLNLSKRLIEEYAHKEVLSKTYEGLSNQISAVSDNTKSEELKYRLLANFLQVSSENPGKLISNYEASDHPIMEALEQSYKFQIAIDRLEGIPGLNKVAAIIESSSKKKLETKKETIEKGLELTNPDSENME